jgi:hypothetical protein
VVVGVVTRRPLAHLEELNNAPNVFRVYSVCHQRTAFFGVGFASGTAPSFGGSPAAIEIVPWRSISMRGF